MGRKKKEEIIHKIDPLLAKPFNPDTDLPSLSLPDIEPVSIDVTTLNDDFVREIPNLHSSPEIVTWPGSTGSYSYYPPYVSPSTITSYPYTGGYVGEVYDPYRSWTGTLSTWPYKELYEKEMEDIKGVKIDSIESSRKNEHIMACQNKDDLTVDKILKTLSAVKGRLMLDVAPVHVKNIECSITPEVRKNIITASKKLKMYGKKKPIVACFDDYGNRLPDEMNIDSMHGIILKIVDPDLYGEFYLELKCDTSEKVKNTILGVEDELEYHKKESKSIWSGMISSDVF